MLGKIFKQKGKHYILPVRSTYFDAVSSKGTLAPKISPCGTACYAKISFKRPGGGGCKISFGLFVQIRTCGIFSLVTVISLGIQQLPLFPTHPWTIARKEETLPEQSVSYICFPMQKCIYIIMYDRSIFQAPSFYT